jgi:ADP-heptose:LPS heptosyltransferase
LSQKPKHILVIRLSAMGDVAMTVPVLRALIQQHPEVKLTVVSRPFFKPFFDGIPNVHFFAVDLQKRHKGFFGLLQLFSDLKKLDIDAVADLHNVLRSKVVRSLFALSGKKVAFTDKGRAEKKALTNLTNKVFKPVKPMVDRHVETFKKLGFSIDLTNPQFPQKAVLSDEILKITENKNQNWVGIAPFAQYEGKVYPLDLMQKVIDELATKHFHQNFSFWRWK